MQITKLDYPAVDYTKIPNHMRHTVENYLERGGPIGKFLTSLFSNDLKMTFAYADDTNIQMIHSWIKFMHNDMPYNSHGSQEKISNWRVERKSAYMLKMANDLGGN